MGPKKGLLVAGIEPGHQSRSHGEGEEPEDCERLGNVADVAV